MMLEWRSAVTLCALPVASLRELQCWISVCGAAVGAELGAAVGEVGETVGDSDGTRAGWPVGTAVGLLVTGDDVGDGGLWDFAWSCRCRDNIHL